MARAETSDGRKVQVVDCCLLPSSSSSSSSPVNQPKIIGWSVSCFSDQAERLGRAVRERLCAVVVRRGSGYDEARTGPWLEKERFALLADEMKAIGNAMTMTMTMAPLSLALLTQESMGDSDSRVLSLRTQ
jgi:hypothetical protein